MASQFRVDPAAWSAAASLRLALTLALALCLAPGALAEGEVTKEAAVIQAGSQVGIEYTLTLEDGTKVDGNVGGDALRFQQGSGQIIPGLDKELLGMAVGDAKKVTVSPEEGYGPVNPEALIQVPLEQIPEDARKPGAQLMTQDPQGRMQRLSVAKVEGETATLDFNHPLAGKTLLFDVKVLEIR